MTNPSRAWAAERFIAWQEKHGWRLANLHADVAAEIASTVRERIQAGEHSGLTEEDRRHCLMRVASRLRIKGHPTPPGEPGSGEQLRECVAAVGGEPIKEAA